MESGQNYDRCGEKGTYGVRFTGIFLKDCWNNKEIVRRFKGNDKNGRMLNPKRLNGQLNV